MSLTPSSLLSAAETAAKKTALSASPASTNQTSSTSSASNANLASLGTNYSTFLTLLTTQLQHQDPSSPMNTDEFTSELAQFAGVEQQVQTNTNLSTLIGATQDQSLVSSKSLIGTQASNSSAQFTLQDGSGAVSFTSASSDPVAIAVSNSSGKVVKTITETPIVGSNTWAWDGTGDGNQVEPNGEYSISVMQAGSGGVPKALATSTSGTVTGVSKGISGVDLSFGSRTTSLDDVSSLGS